MPHAWSLRRSGANLSCDKRGECSLTASDSIIWGPLRTLDEEIMEDDQYRKIYGW